ncbi:MAG: hypothetical protein ABR987_08105 [Terracidiphilus sp.]|jgi:hypothetical protein
MRQHGGGHLNPVKIGTSNAYFPRASLEGKNINFFIEPGPALGPVLEVTVANVEEARSRLVKNGCEVVKDEPEFPRTYVRDPFGLIYNLTT